MRHSHPTLERMQFLLEMIHNRAMALPDFQRDFVWDPSATDELIESIISNEPPESVTDLKFDINLRQVRPRQRAVYRGIMALVLQNGAIDFYKRGKITSQLLADKKNPVDHHHVFPRAYLDDRSVSPSLRDCILNRTFIDRSTNRRLSMRSPSDYFGEIRAKQGENETDQMLRSHLLPEGPNSPLLEDNFEALLDWREHALKELINSKTS